MSHIAADAILLLHFAFVEFVVAGLAAIWAGAFLHWTWIRNRRFRLAHLAAICLVAVEALLGIMCPLTVWEDALRGRNTESGFVSRWVHRVMFYNLPEWMFTAAYVAFAAIVLATYRLVPPRKKIPR